MDFLARFCDDLVLRGMSDGTSHTYFIVLNQFSRYIKEKGIDLGAVGKAELKDFLLHLRLERKLKMTTINLNFSILASFYDFLLDEEIITQNPIPSFRKRNLRAYKRPDESGSRKIISIDEAARLVNSIADSRDRAIILMLLKTGVRRHELSELDLENVDLEEMTIRLKPTPKRSNRTLFFDSEAREALEWWLYIRGKMTCRDKALFIGAGGVRLKPDSINRIIEEHAERVGLHDSKSKKIEDKFTAHCCRHWFTTHLIRSGMPRDFVKELRGDSRHEAIDIYNHIDKKELRESYLAHIPQLGI